MQNGSQTTILLNRPKALNAIDTEMVQLIQEAINACPAENHIVLRGKGRALCSGGDVLAVVNAANSQDSATRQEALTFFQNEFQLDFNIASLDTQSRPRVFVSFMDGITMGGGVGLSVHAPIRVATEKTMFAMPETGIGYWPDVGVTRNLARLDGRIGVYLGMTGARITGEEAYLAGLATHFITSSMVDESVRRLSVLPRNATAEQIADTLDEFSVDPFNKVAHERAEEVLSKSAFVGARRLALDYAFGQDRAEDVIVALQDLAQGNVDSKAGKALQKIGADVSQDGIAAWASTTLKTLEQKSPRSLKVTFESVRRARAYDVSQAFHADMRLATAFCDFGLGRDFYEGVTFTLTKDPKTGKRREGVADWNPRTIEEVSDADVDRIFFGPLEEAKQAGMKMEVPTLQGIRAAPSDAKERKKQAAAIKGIGPLGWERDYNRLALPSEAECEALREGSHPAAGDYTLTVDEIVKILRNHKSDKPGLEFKVKEWLERKQLSK
jgi:3-hydroxyisobutyryl-CoA hydrolase